MRPCSYQTEHLFHFRYRLAFREVTLLFPRAIFIKNFCAIQKSDLRMVWLVKAMHILGHDTIDREFEKNGQALFLYFLTASFVISIAYTIVLYDYVTKLHCILYLCAVNVRTALKNVLIWFVCFVNFRSLWRCTISDTARIWFGFTTLYENFMKQIAKSSRRIAKKWTTIYFLCNRFYRRRGS